MPILNCACPQRSSLYSACKPEAVFFQAAMAAVHASPESHMYFVDDSRQNVEAAHALGWQSCGMCVRSIMLTQYTLTRIARQSQMCRTNRPTLSTRQFALARSWPCPTCGHACFINVVEVHRSPRGPCRGRCVTRRARLTWGGSSCAAVGDGPTYTFYA